MNHHFSSLLTHVNSRLRDQLIWFFKSFLIILFITTSLLVNAQVGFRNNELTSYPGDWKNADSIGLAWDRNHSGGGLFSNDDRPMFFYWDNDNGGAWGYLLDTRNMINLKADFYSANIRRQLTVNTTQSTHALFKGSFSGIQGITVSRDGGDYIQILTNHSGYGSGLSAASKLRFAVNGNGIQSPSMVIDTNGNVGIGVPVPTRKLTVDGDIYGTSEVRGLSLRANGIIETDKTNKTKFQFARRDFSGSHAILFNAYMDISVDGSLYATGNTKYANDQGANHGGAGGIFFNANGGSMIFGISPVSEGANEHINWGDPKMYINRDGEVGIGTASPSAKLTVNGDILSSEVRVESISNGPDYVFEETYDLTSLEDLEAYIQVNKHLPEVPSAAEMKSEGIELAEMNMILLKKVEELTLHQIRMSKTINEQQNELDEYKKLVNELLSKKDSN